MKVIVIIDMQHDFVDGVLGTPEAQAIVPTIAERLRKDYNPETTCVLFTKDTHYEDTYMESQEGKNLPIPHCIKDTNGWCIVKEIASEAMPYPTIDNHKIVNGRICKPTFGSIDLTKCLAEKADAIDEVILMGVCTDICVVANSILLKTFLPETLITVDASCCAGVTPEKHAAALETMKSCQINVINE